MAAWGIPPADAGRKLTILKGRYKMIDALLVVAAVAVTVGILLGLITLTVHLRVDTEKQLRNTWRNEGL